MLGEPPAQHRFAVRQPLAAQPMRRWALAVLWHRLARRPLPKVKGTIEVPELRGRVRVRRDRWGVPHVEADERDDLFFAQGYCHGQDRLWQLNFYRRVVEGRISEMAGE